MRNSSLLVFCLFFSFLLSAQTTELKKGYRKNFYKNGKLESEGAEKKGQKEKLWKYYDSTGVLLKTENYLHGKLTGEQRKFSEGTKIYARTMYVDSMREGMCYLYFPNGQIQEKSLYKNDSVVLQYTYTMQGLYSIRSFEHDLPTGTARYYDPSGSIRDTAAEEVVHYKDGFLDGPYFLYDNGKLTLEEHYTTGHRDGDAKKYEDGKLVATFHYVDGYAEGEVLNYSYADGSRQYVSRKFNYCHGTLCGLAYYFSAAGDTTMKIFYRDGIADSIYRYNDFDQSKKGRLYERCVYRRGFISIPFYTVYRYDNTGKLTERYIGKLNSDFSIQRSGTAWTFYPDGKVETKTRYGKNGVDSIYTKWYPSGKRMLSANVDAGILLEAPWMYNEVGAWMRPGSPEYNTLFNREINEPIRILSNYYDPKKSNIAWDPKGIAQTAVPTDTTANVPKLPDFPKMNDPKIADVMTAKPAMPAFFAGGDEAWHEFILGQMNLPASKKKIKGDVTISFEVNASGYVENFAIQREISGHPEVTNEVLRVIKLSPRWAPAVSDGKYVRTKVVTTVHF